MLILRYGGIFFPGEKSVVMIFILLLQEVEKIQEELGFGIFECGDEL